MIFHKISNEIDTKIILQCLIYMSCDFFIICGMWMLLKIFTNKHNNLFSLWYIYSIYFLVYTFNLILIELLILLRTEYETQFHLCLYLNFLLVFNYINLVNSRFLVISSTLKSSKNVTIFILIFKVRLLLFIFITKKIWIIIVLSMLGSNSFNIRDLISSTFVLDTCLLISIIVPSFWEC